MASNIEEIKQKVDLVDLVGEYARLTPAGSNFKANCPFHQEKTASFIVSPERQIWHCFGCGLGGDQFKFIQQIEGVDFPEALRILANRAGVKLESFKPEEHNQKTRLLDLLKTLTSHWQNILWEDSKVEFVREYLKKRGVTEAIAKEYALGYALESWDDVVKYLQDKGYSLKEMADAGVSIVGDKGRPYDRFRNRLMFAIRDVHGNVVGFTGRKMNEEDKGGKYVNSPQTLVYNKSHVLYNLDLAKTEIRRLGYVILVEGNMDALSCYQAGTKNAVAVSGTALTEDQIKLIKRFTNNVMIAFDADAAGLNANLRGVDLAWQAGLNVKVINLAGGKDPDELIKENPDKWKESIKKSQNFMDYLFMANALNLDLTRVDHKKTYAKKLLPLIGKLGDEVERAHYLNKLADILNVSVEVLSSALKQVPGTKNSKQAVNETAKPASIGNQDRLTAEHLLGLILRFPGQAKNVFSRLEPEMITFAPASELYKELLIYYNKDQRLDHQILLGLLPERQATYFSQLALFDDEDINEDHPELINHEIVSAVKRLKEQYLKSKQQLLGRQIKQAEEAGNLEQANTLTKELMELFRQLAEL